MIWPSSGRLAADGPTYTITDLGTIEGNVPTVTGMNASGQLAGWFSGSDSDHAARYTDQGGWARVPGLESTSASYATGINDNGDVVGYAVLPTGAMRAFRHVEDGTVNGVTEFVDAMPGGTFTLAFAINNSGEIAGYGVTAAGVRAFRRAPGLDPVAIDAFGGAFTGGCAINDNGDVAGFAATPDGVQHAYRQSPDGTVVEVPGLAGAGSSSSACALDAAGTMTGQAAVEDGSMHAFVASSGTPASIDTFAAASSNGSSIAAGVVVGSFTLGDGTQHAFRYAKDTGSVDLNGVANDPAWVLNSATAVNASGVIAGVGMHNGVAAAFRLTPSTPKDTEPPTIGGVSASPSVIQVPNGAMVPVTVTVSATDNVDATPACSISGITGGAAGDSNVTGAFGASVRATGGAVYTVGVRCRDAAGNAADGSTTVTVLRDTQAPAITSLAAAPASLQPNKRMVPVTVSVSATDNVDAAPSCSITEIGSSDGATGDAQITGDLTALVRAALDSRGGTRIYSLRVTCGDAGGNLTSGDATVEVKGGTRTVTMNKRLRLAIRHWSYRRHHGRGRR